MTGLFVGYIFLFISCLVLDAKIRALEDLMDSQFELDKTIGETLKNNGEFNAKLSDIVNKHLDRENEIFEQMSNFLKEEEDKDGTL